MTKITTDNNKKSQVLALIQGKLSLNQLLDDITRNEYESTYDESYNKYINNYNSRETGAGWVTELHQPKWTRRIR